MKKLLALVLLLCLVCTSAFAAGNLERTETRVVRDAKDNGKYDINVYIQVKNTGDAPVSLDKAVIYLYDANNVALDDETAYSMYPSLLQPGEVGYIYREIYNAEASLATAIASYSINITPEHKYLDEIAHLTHYAEYAEVKANQYSNTEPLTYFSITNDYADTVWNPIVVCVVRSTEGKILTIQSTTVYDVGIPAGNTVIYEKGLGTSELKQWTESGHTVGSIETFSYINLD